MQLTKARLFDGGPISLIAVLVLAVALLAALELTAIDSEQNVENQAPVGQASVIESGAVGARAEGDFADGDLYRRSGSMTPAQAAVTGKPTVLYFYPFEMCQIRYCRQPADVASELEQSFGASVNFVAVTSYASDEKEDSSLTFDNWDLYLVPPYDEWVPESEQTVFGQGLEAPVTILVDGTGRRVAQDSEFITVAEIAELLEVTAIAER